MLFENIKTYILHCKSLTDRLPHIENQIKNINLKNYEYYLDFDKEELTDEHIKFYYDSSPSSWYKKFTNYLYPSVAPHRILNRGITSLNIKHVNVYEKIANGLDDICMILEDDVIFDQDNLKILKSKLNDLPSDFDMIFIGSCCGLRIDNPNPNQFFYKKESPSAKCTDSFLITKSCCEKLVSSIVPFSLPIDFELNYHIDKLNLNIYWIEPPCTVQGSQTGLFDTTCTPEGNP